MIKKCIVGKKIGMTQVFDEKGKLIFQKIYPISEVPNLSLVVDAVMAV